MQDAEVPVVYSRIQEILGKQSPMNFLNIGRVLNAADNPRFKVSSRSPTPLMFVDSNADDL